MLWEAHGGGDWHESPLKHCACFTMPHPVVVRFAAQIRVAGRHIRPCRVAAAIYLLAPRRTCIRGCESSVLTVDCVGLQAANAGGVAVSGLEMSQNAVGLQWSREEVDSKLKVRACTLRMANLALSMCCGTHQHTLRHCNPLVDHVWPACCDMSALLPLHCS